MAEIQDHVAYLSQEIGSRPAGTEEEQAAAQYIANELQHEAGLSAVIEDFNCIIDYEKTTIIVCVIAFVFAMLSLFIPFMAVPAIIITVITAAIYAMEAFERPVLSRMLSKGLSQNVVAHYVPDYSAKQGGSRRRKVILVAHYDSGKLRPDLHSGLASLMPLIMRIELVCMIVLPLLVILHGIFLPNLAGAGLVVLRVITIIVAAFALIAAIGAFMRKTAKYSVGANCNASGVGVLMGLAEQISSARRYAYTAQESPSPEFLGEADGQPVVHGLEAAFAAGVVPQNADLVYNEAVQPNAPIDPDATVAFNRLNIAAAAASPSPAASGELGSAEERLEAAKQAIEAFTGRPVERRTYRQGSSAATMVQAPVDGAVMQERALAAETAADAALSEEVAARAGYRAEELRERLVDKDGVSAGQAASEALEQAQQQTFFAAPTPFEHKDVPDWFKAAQAKAKKTENGPTNIQRSQFADALDTAAEVSRARAQQEAPQPDLEYARQRLQQIRENIMNVKAPTLQDEASGEDNTLSATEAVALGMQAGEGMEALYQGAGSTIEGAASDDQPQLSFAQQPAGEELVDGKTIGFMPVNVFEEAEKAQGTQEALKAGASQKEAPTAATASEAVASAVASIPSLAAITTNDFEKKKERKKRRKRQMILPDTMKAEKDLMPLEESQKQPAPIAFSKAGAPEVEAFPDQKSLSQRIPMIVSEGKGASVREGLGALPYISTSFKPIEAQTISASAEDIASKKTVAIPPVKVSDPFTPSSGMLLGTSGVMEGLSSEQEREIEHFEHHDDEMFVVDADDSAYIGEFEEGGAYASASHVDMPKSRASRIFGRFRRNRKRNADELSPQEWLDVEEDFDAREIGAARGGWESFQEESDKFEEQRNQHRNWEGGYAPYSDDEYAFGQDERYASQRLEGFHNPPLNMEVWFVALGAELARDAGMKAFLAEHAQDMRGAIVIDIGALGAGRLSLITSEGAAGTVNASNRMKRYVQKAADSMGFDIGEASLAWADTAASVAQKQGHQAMHLVGMDGPLPAYFGSKNDVFENIDDEVIQANANFVMELLRNI